MLEVFWVQETAVGEREEYVTPNGGREPFSNFTNEPVVLNAENVVGLEGGW